MGLVFPLLLIDDYPVLADRLSKQEPTLPTTQPRSRRLGSRGEEMRPEGARRENRRGTRKRNDEKIWEERERRGEERRETERESESRTKR